MTAIDSKPTALLQASRTPRPPVRVAYVVHSMHAGGLEKCVADLVNHLDRSEWQPLVICLTESGEALKWIERDDVQVVEMHKRRGQDFRLPGRLTRLFRELRVDIAHSHNWGTLVETSLACRRAQVAHVHAEHGLELGDLRLRGLKTAIRRWGRRWAFNRADAVVAVADSVRRRMEQSWGFPADRVRWIPNGVCTPRLTDLKGSRGRLRSEIGVPADSVLLGSVGRLAPVKDFGTAIAAIGELRRRSMQVDLVLVGDGPQREQLQQLAHSHNVAGHVHLLGYRRDVGDWLRACDLYVNSSLGEAMSLSILEAMAMGLPVVATDVGDNAHLVGGNGPCGLFVPPGNPTALAEAIQTLVVDPERRTELGKRGKSRHEVEFSMDSMVAGYVELYDLVRRTRLASVEHLTSG